MTYVTAQLLISTACPHCASVLQGLSELVKAGTIARLDIVNISESPETATQYAVRSVPYLRLGEFEFEGLQSPAELKFWAEQAVSKTGMVAYFNEALKSGGLNKVLRVLNKDKTQFAAIVSLLQDPDTELQVRVGIGAIMEEYEGSAELLDQIEHFAELAQHSDPRVRLDACHYLALTHAAQAKPFVELLLVDENPDVREVAQESLDLLNNPAPASERH